MITQINEDCRFCYFCLYLFFLILRNKVINKTKIKIRCESRKSKYRNIEKIRKNNDLK